MRWWIAAGLSLFLAPPAAATDAEALATVTGEKITRDQLAGAADGAASASRLLEVLWERIARHYIARERLAATPQELAELVAYDREFRARDRAQRARKLEELNRRLRDDGLAPAERAHLEEFRAVLTRMARRDAENDKLPPPTPERQAALFSPVIVLWKMNGSLYERYGGTVALTRGGHVPHGARAALIEDYERRGLLSFTDKELRERLYALISARPAIVVPPESVDFTPFWKRPIPPSYYPH